MIVFCRDLTHHLEDGAAFGVDHLATLAGFGDQLIHLRHETAPAGCREQQPPPLARGHDGDDRIAAIDIHHGSDRLAKSSRAGQLVRAQRVETPAGRGDQQLVGRLRLEALRKLVAFLVFHAGNIVAMALHRTDPAALGDDHGQRLALDHGLQRHLDGCVSLFQPGAPRAQRRILGIVLAQLGNVLLQPRALPGGAFEQLHQPVTFLGQHVALALQLHLLQLAQGAQPHVQDRLGLPVGKLELFHQHRLGLILGPDDGDHPVEIEIGDDIAFEQFQPRIDGIQPVLRTALQHDNLVLQPMLQHLAQPHHHGGVRGVQHIHVE